MRSDNPDSNSDAHGDAPGALQHERALIAAARQQAAQARARAAPAWGFPADAPPDGDSLVGTRVGSPPDAPTDAPGRRSPGSSGAPALAGRGVGGNGANAIPPLRDLIPGYEIEREIHRGGQGVVYQALQKSTHRQVAIKVMKEGPFAGADDKARFDREVRILAQLNHPSIVAIHDSGTAGGCFYFVMNYIAGAPLDAYLRDAGLTLDQTLRLFAEICEAVNAAHLRGIIHGDLKLSNIRVTPPSSPPQGGE